MKGKIIKSAVISHHELQKFYNSLYEEINIYEKQHLETEVQFQTSPLMDGHVRFSALILGRQK